MSDGRGDCDRSAMAWALSLKNARAEKIGKKTAPSPRNQPQALLARLLAQRKNPNHSSLGHVFTVLWVVFVKDILHPLRIDSPS